jgi:hypothetical protein
LKVKLGDSDHDDSEYFIIDGAISYDDHDDDDHDHEDHICLVCVPLGRSTDGGITSTIMVETGRQPVPLLHQQHVIEFSHVALARVHACNGTGTETYAIVSPGAYFCMPPKCAYMRVADEKDNVRLYRSPMQDGNYIYI